MNCRDIESLILAERDGVLTTDQHAALSAHVAACPACRSLHARVAEVSAFLKSEAANLAVPDVNEEWRRLHARLPGAAKPARKRPLAPIIWFSAPLAAAAALVLGFLLTRPVATPLPVEETSTATIAYVDKDSGWLVVWATETDKKGSG